MFSQWKKYVKWGGEFPSSRMLCDYLTYTKTGIKSTGLDSAKWAIDQIHKLKQTDEPSKDGSVKNHLKGLKRILIEEHLINQKLTRSNQSLLMTSEIFHFQMI